MIQDITKAFLMLSCFTQTKTNLTSYYRDPPRIPELLLSESAFRDAALAYHHKFKQFMSILHDIACGKDLKMFLLVQELKILHVLIYRS